ncbi:hypothetical protein ACTFIY_008818 [Dictyostelium cf. discoideum]
MNKKLTKIIEKDIIILLINYLLIPKNKKYINKNFYYSKLELYCYHDEILNLCLVSKEWYFLISPLISNEIIKDHGEDIIMDKWFREELYKNQYKEQFRNILNINSVESLKQKIVSDFFSNKIIIIKSNGKNYPDTEKYKNFKRVCFVCVDEIQYHTAYSCLLTPNRQLLSEIANFNKPLGVELKFWKKIQDNLVVDKYFYSPQFLYCFCKFNNFNKLIELKIDNFQFSHLVINDLTQLKVLKLYSVSLSIHASTLQPGTLISLNTRCPNLKTLAIQVPFHLINKHYHGCKITKQCFPGNNLSKNISQEWNELIATLSNNISIENLTISNFPCEHYLDPINCYQYSNLEFNDNTIKCISDGFYNLIKNNKSIKFLRLINIDLLHNFSIGPSFSTSIIEYLFSNIFNKNNVSSSYNYSSIRRIKFYVDKMDSYSSTKWISFILNCIKKYPNTTLYSIQLPIEIFDNYDEVISLFQSRNSISINELILDFPYNNNYRMINQRQIIDKILDLKKQIQTTINNNIFKSDNKTLVSFYLGKNYPPLEEFS